MIEKVEIQIDGTYVEIEPVLRITTYSDFGPELCFLVIWSEGETTHWYDGIQTESSSTDQNISNLLTTLKTSGSDYFLLTEECTMSIDSQDTQLINQVIQLLDIPLDEAKIGDGLLIDRKLVVNGTEFKITADGKAVGF